jgi:hypothetical protein
LDSVVPRPVAKHVYGHGMSRLLTVPNRLVLYIPCAMFGHLYPLVLSFDRRSRGGTNHCTRIIYPMMRMEGEAHCQSTLILNFRESMMQQGSSSFVSCDLSSSAEVDVRPATFVHDLALAPVRVYHDSRERGDHDDPPDMGVGARPEDVHGARHGRSQQLGLQQQQHMETYAVL